MISARGGRAATRAARAGGPRVSTERRAASRRRAAPAPRAPCPRRRRRRAALSAASAAAPARAAACCLLRMLAYRLTHPQHCHIYLPHLKLYFTSFQPPTTTNICLESYIFFIFQIQLYDALFNNPIRINTLNTLIP